VTLINERHGLAHRVRFIVNRAMAGIPGEGSSNRGRARVGLSRSNRGRAPVTQWPPQHVHNQGTPISSCSYPGHSRISANIFWLLRM
jgi:hypothetical protein